MSPFKTADWLEQNLSNPDIRIVDASWYLPNIDANAFEDYRREHIPGAVFFPIDEIADKTSDLPHMVAKPDVFASEVGKLGISEKNTIVVYDNKGLFSAARVWWNFRVMGAKNVFVLLGGLPAWKACSFATTSGEEHYPEQKFIPHFSPELVASWQDVLKALDNPEIQVVDVRPAERFAGTQPEPRAGIRSGHMPNALNMPFMELTAEGVMQAPERIEAILSAHNVDPNKPVIASCGSGVTAPILSLALAAAGHDNLKVYDGSWTEWGGRKDLPVVKNER